MEIRTELGQAGAHRARGTVVVIDVFRAFTVSAYALAAGARECLLVRTVEEARELAAEIPGAYISAEIEGLPVPGIPVSNSPTQVAALDLEGRVLIQRTSAGTQGVAAAAEAAERVLAASLVVATATARRLQKLKPPLVTLVATGEPGGHLEDRECAALLTRLLRGEPADGAGTVARIRAGDHYAELAQGEIPGFPTTDLELALDLDRFGFALEMHKSGGLLALRRAAA